jgi:Plasmid pRiA4b ORF-3-like protein
VPRTWLQIQVDLLGGGGVDLDPPPGRILIVGPGHTFEQLADAINQAFARWDLSHLHEFELSDDRLIGYPNDEFAPELTWEDHAKLKVCREVKPGDEFTFTFDLGDNWRHHCTVGPQKADPLHEYGAIPSEPVPIWGWGSIPDQYGRTSLEE